MLNQFEKFPYKHRFYQTKLLLTTFGRYHHRRATYTPEHPQTAKHRKNLDYVLTRLDQSGEVRPLDKPKALSEPESGYYFSRANIQK